MERIFGISGTENLDVVEPAHGAMINLCSTRRGRPTAFVAETYGRLMGEPGVCISALGPGMLSFCFIARAGRTSRI